MDFGIRFSKGQHIGIGGERFVDCEIVWKIDHFQSECRSLVDPFNESLKNHKGDIKVTYLDFVIDLIFKSGKLIDVRLNEIILQWIQSLDVMIECSAPDRVVQRQL